MKEVCWGWRRCERCLLGVKGFVKEDIEGWGMNQLLKHFFRWMSDFEVLM